MTSTRPAHGSCELADLLLHAETAGKQLITDIANVPALVCAMQVLNLIIHQPWKLHVFLFFRASIVDWYQYPVIVRVFGCICTAGVFS